MRMKTHQISPAQTNPYPPTPVLTPYQSPSKPTPQEVIRENPRESAVLKERTQFYNRKTPLTLCLTTTYINRCLPSQKNTNPFSPVASGLPAPAASLLGRTTTAGFSPLDKTPPTSLNPMEAPSKTTPKRQTSKNPRESMSKDLKERTQFPRSTTGLNLLYNNALQHSAEARRRKNEPSQQRIPKISCKSRSPPLKFPS